MSKFYRRHMAPTLAERLDAHLQRAGESVTDLSEEVALSRVMLEQALAMHAALLELKQKGAELPHGAVELAESAIRDGLTHVAEMCKSMSRIERDLQDGVSAKNLGSFVEQLAQVIYRKLGDTDEAREIEVALREQVYLPDGSVGNLNVPMPIPIRVTYEDDATVPASNGHPREAAVRKGGEGKKRR
jgi:hypothetical protein